MFNSQYKRQSFDVVCKVKCYYNTDLLKRHEKFQTAEKLAGRKFNGSNCSDELYHSETFSARRALKKNVCFFFSRQLQFE